MKSRVEISGVKIYLWLTSKLDPQVIVWVDFGCLEKERREVRRYISIEERNNVQRWGHKFSTSNVSDKRKKQAEFQNMKQN